MEHNATTYTNLTQGFKAQSVSIECHLSNGLPSITIVGMGNKSVEESKERIRGAFSSSSLQLPRKHIILNLAPADVPKEGSSFDVAIALSILLADQQIKIHTSIKRLVVYGELGLTGEIRPIRGLVGRLQAAKDSGATHALIPLRNLSQARLIDGIEIIPVSSLKEVYGVFTGAYTPIKIKPFSSDELTITPKNIPDFASIVGQPHAKRAAEIASAGGHNLLLDGPPGSGKSMLAKALPGILPPMSRSDIVEVTHLHSLGLGTAEDIITKRPIQAPHHSTSAVAVLGGGQSPRPGAVSLSHKGILFLDELPEFGRHIIDSLRQPLEDKTISVARAKAILEFPADFMLIATRNPCPCGYYGTPTACSCLPNNVLQYRKRISGPVLDRIDLYVSVSAVSHDKLLDGTPEEYSASIRERVMRARKVQEKRFGTTNKTNSLMSNDDIKNLAHLEESAKLLLNQASTKLNLSARSYMRIIKVARTIADLDLTNSIEARHMAEALQYRQKTIQL